MDWQPQILGIRKDTFHPIIQFKFGMAHWAFHLAQLWFKGTCTAWAFNRALL